MSSMLDRFRQRKLFQWSVAYLAVAWVLLQALDLIGDKFAWPVLPFRIATVILGVGFFAVLLLAWFHGEKGRQRVGALELVALALLFGAAGVGVAMVLRGSTESRSGESKAVASADRSIAVLPFRNMSDNKENEYFSEGITEDLLTHLAKVGSLRVISRTSVMQYKGTRKTIPEIARELGVAHILEGSVQRAGNRVRITAQLIRAGQEEHLWAEAYDRDLSDIFAVQTEIARAIANALSATLTAADRSHVQAGQTESVGAYDLHLRGREVMRNGIDDTLQVKRAMTLFRNALALDPRFALAEASLSDGHRVLGARDSAFAAARRAIQIAPDLAEGYTALAATYRIGGQFREALVEARKAVERNPNYADAISEIGYMTGELGGLDEALPWAKRALRLEPTDPSNYISLGVLYQQMGAHPEAERQFKQALHLDPGNGAAQHFSSLNALGQGDRARARALADSLAGRLGGWPEANLRWQLGDIAPLERLLKDDSVTRYSSYTEEWAYILQRRGKRAEAEAFITRAEARAHQRIAEGDQARIPSRLLTLVHALRGNQTEALRALRVWIDHGLRDPNELIFEPMLGILQEDPEFLRIVQSMKEHQAQMRGRAQREGWW